jgi:hypothetical protein
MVDFVTKEKMEIRHDLPEVMISPEAEKKIRALAGPEAETVILSNKVNYGHVESGYRISGLYISRELTDGRGVYVVPRRKVLNDWVDESADAVAAVNVTMDAIKKRGPGPIFAPPMTPEGAKEFNKSFSTYANAKGNAGDMITASHEIAHAVHDRTGGAYPQVIELNGKPTQMTLEIGNKIVSTTSTYGMTAPGEAFAEHFTLWLYAGERFKKESPEAYAWIDAIVDIYRKSKTA